jgi:hypothetical protein
MKPLLKKMNCALAILLLTTTAAYSQKEFFRSQQVFKEGQLDKFYSSITIHDSMILFNANDYHLYAYNKNNGSLKWAYKNNYKTVVPVFVVDNIIYAAASQKEEPQAVQISLADGKLIKTLPFGPLQTKPTVKNGILYGTATYNYGCIIAYDLQKDTVAWSRFIAHGLSRQPYYFDNKILANAEGDNWVELGYDGVLLDTTCAVKASIFVAENPCVKNFTALSHDGLEIKGKLAANIFENNFNDQPDLLTTKKFTYVLSDGKLSILAAKLKLKQQVAVSSLAIDLVETDKTKLLKADDENIWLLYADHLLQYNHKTKLLVKLTDLTAWQPQQVLFDGENIWLISGKDGLLYGLSF